MPATIPYTEEAFGILTDDNLYLDCILVKPANLADNQLRMLRVWVPKYPLTKASTITCARQEVRSYGADGKIAHLVFDLRGTGDSDGVPGDQNFDLDLKAIRAWAEERFGRINFGFFGFPHSEKGAGLYVAFAPGHHDGKLLLPSQAARPFRPPACSIWPATATLPSRMRPAAWRWPGGYSTYALDPLRYLAARQCRTAVNLPGSGRRFAHPDSNAAQPAHYRGSTPGGRAGPALGGRKRKFRGVVAIGRAQSGLAASHVFQNRNPHNFKLSPPCGQY
jgi:hypothetical protein